MFGCAHKRRGFRPGRLLLPPLVIGMMCVSELHSQGHTAMSEMAGNYSGEFFDLTSRSGLRSGWNAIRDTLEGNRSEMTWLSTIYIPVSGDITESPTFAVGAEIPFSWIAFTEIGLPKMSRSGLGDVALTGKYEFAVYSESTSTWLPRKAKIDFIGKIKFPTGDTHGIDARGLASPDDLQLGGGSTDFAVGVAFLTETEEYFMVHGHVLYWINTPADHDKMGNTFNYELSFIPVPLSVSLEPLGTFLPKLGISGMHSEPDDMNGDKVENSGGDVIALSVGVLSLWSYLPAIGTFWMVDASYQLPILQRLNSVQIGYGSSITAGLRIFVK
jgi:hypothetical protein